VLWVIVTGIPDDDEDGRNHDEKEDGEEGS